THYATLVAGLTTGGGVEMCNAGHCKALVLRRDGTDQMDSTGFPLGLFCEGRDRICSLKLSPGDCVGLYSDGIPEAQDPDGNEYDEERLIGAIRAHAGGDVIAMADGVVRDVARFRGSRVQQDDITLLVVRKRAES